MATVDEEVKLTKADADAIKTQGEKDLTASNEMYDEMVAKNDAAKDQALGLIETNKAEQERIQNQQTDFAIEQINQQKDQAKKDYTKEQSGAYVDWQKQSNEYGANAEQRASMGMAGTGYAESSQVSMYNQYQTRITAARESYNRAVLNYDNAIKEAKLQNSAVLAEIAAQALEKSLEITLSFAQQNNTLLQAKANAAIQIKTQTNSAWLGVLDAIRAQDALEETIRHNKETEGLANRQFEWQKDQANKSLTINKTSGGSSHTIKTPKKAAESTSKVTKNGVTLSNKTSRLQDTENRQYEKGGNSKPTYESTANYMQKKGVATGDGGLMTKAEWMRRKNSGSNRAETSYATYEDYLNSFAAWRVANPEK